MHADNIRRVSRDRPCVIVAYCAGGNLAIEIGRALRAQSQEVPLVVLIDVKEPSLRREPASSSYRERAVARVQVLRESDLATVYAWVRNLFSGFARSAARQSKFALAIVAARARLPVPRFAQQVYRNEMNKRVIHRTKPGRYEGDVLIFRSAAMDGVTQEDLGWSRSVNGRIETVRIEGSHAFLSDSVDAARLLAVELDGRIEAAAGR
jgi:thioesterase domain-containing protein